MERNQDAKECEGGKEVDALARTLRKMGMTRLDDNSRRNAKLLRRACDATARARASPPEGQSARPPIGTSSACNHPT